MLREQGVGGSNPLAPTTRNFPPMFVWHFLVQGRVQGVGFRYFVCGEARRLGLAGFVRNLPDGSVEALARGTAEALELLEGRIRLGPPGSRVDSVRVRSHAGENFEKDFEIRG